MKAKGEYLFRMNQDKRTQERNQKKQAKEMEFLEKWLYNEPNDYVIPSEDCFFKPRNIDGRK